MSDQNLQTPQPGTFSQVTPRTGLLLATNANAWTFGGTNTWLLAEPDDDRCVIVDPGPDDPAHLDRILEGASSRTIAEIWLTHSHHDHADAAWPLAELTGARIRSADPALPAEPLPDNARLVVGGLHATVLATPGHTRDSVCLLLDAEPTVLTGDTLLGRGSPVVQPGGMTDTLQSLERLAELTADERFTALPGHGPVVPDAHPSIQTRLASRRRRIAEVAEHLAAGRTDPATIARLVYPHVTDRVTFHAAVATTTAAIDHLLLGCSEPSDEQ